MIPTADSHFSALQKDVQPLAHNYGQVRTRIEAAARRAGRNPDDITLVAISKTQPLALVEMLYQIGHRHFGENRADEGIQKVLAARETFAPDADPISWHMIGHIQSRKAKSVVAGFDQVHSLDSIRLAQRLSRFAAENGTTVPLLLECNVSGEVSKHGFEAAQAATNTEQWETLTRAVTQIVELPYLKIHGLMTMAPIVNNPDAARPYFMALRKLRDRLATRFPESHWETLSMGMSSDFEVAIEEGATILRVGRAIFGERLSH